jgi:SAM-dependent methyltransferase
MHKRPLRDIDDKYWQEYWRTKARYFPQSQNCQEQYENLIERYLEKDTIWLDAGCGHILLHYGGEKKSHQFAGTVKTVVGIDADLNGLSKNYIIHHRAVGDLGSLPFKNDSFTLLTCNMVIEHVRNPARFVKEIRRILKPQGVAIIHTPNLFHYEPLLAYITPHKFHDIYCWIMESRESSDVFPVIYRANTLFKVKQLFHSEGMIMEWGNTIVDVPKRFPVPLLHKVLLFLNILEVNLLSTRFMTHFRHNLLVAFRKTY